MKTQTIIRAIMIFFFAITISCSKDSTTEETEINVLEAKVSGKLTNFGGVLMEMEYFNNFAVWGCTNNQYISLGFPLDSELGTYIIPDDNISAKYEHGDVCCYFDCGPVYKYDAIEGSITLQEITETKVKGTFHFVSQDGAGDIRVITEGRFDLYR